MTHHTDAERAEFEATFAKLYDDWVFDAMSNSAAKRAAFLVWQAARRAPAAPVPQETCVICGSNEPYTGTCGSNDPRALCKKPAPQPPEAVQSNSAEFDGIEKAAAPVELPEPVANFWQHGETGRTRVVMPDAITDCDAGWQRVGALYTEQQVRQLLANHGIKEQST